MVISQLFERFSVSLEIKLSVLQGPSDSYFLEVNSRNVFVTWFESCAVSPKNPPLAGANPLLAGALLVVVLLLEGVPDTFVGGIRHHPVRLVRVVGN